MGEEDAGSRARALPVTMLEQPLPHPGSAKPGNSHFPPCLPALFVVGPVPGLGARSTGGSQWREEGGQPLFCGRGRSLGPCSVVEVWEHAIHPGRLWG